MNNRIELSPYGNASAAASPVSQMMAEVASDFRDGIDINLGVGYVNEATIPRKAIVEATRQVVDNPQTYRLSLNYGAPQGSSHLIKALKKQMVQEGLGDLDNKTLDRNKMIIGPNGATSLLESIAHVLPTGIVITTEPCYYIYCHFLARLGFKVLTIGEDDEGIDLNQLEECLQQMSSDQHHLSFIYLCSVNNPTCTILSNNRRRQIVEMVTQLSKTLHRKIPLILDKAYEHLIHDPGVKKPQSALPHDRLGIVYEISTLSKVLAPALRIGYMIGPDNDFMKAMIQRSSDAGFSAPLLNQHVASVLIGKNFHDQLNSVNQAYRTKAIQVKQWLSDYLGPYLKQTTGGQAGFYYYLTFKNLKTDETSPLFKFLTRTTGDPAIDGPVKNKNPRALYIPGIHFAGPGNDPDLQCYYQCRISYGYEEAEPLEKALKLFRQGCDYAQLQTSGTRGQ